MSHWKGLLCLHVFNATACYSTLKGHFSFALTISLMIAYGTTLYCLLLVLMVCFAFIQQFISIAYKPQCSHSVIKRQGARGYQRALQVLSQMSEYVPTSLP